MVGNLTKKNKKCQMPGGEPGGGMGTLGFDSYIMIISTSLPVPGQPSPRFYLEAWLPFRNCEMDYYHWIKIG